MTTGLQTTLSLLATTNNEAATKLLLDTLDREDRTVQTESLKSLLKRRSLHGHLELLRRWDRLSERHTVTIAEQSHRMAGALRRAVLGADDDLLGKGLDAVVRLREYDLLPTLMTAAEDRANPRAKDAGRAALGLCEMLYEELTSARDYRNRRDPHRTRKFVVDALEESVKRFDQHRRSELVEAFLLLSTPHNAVLRQFSITCTAKPTCKSSSSSVTVRGRGFRSSCWTFSTILSHRPRSIQRSLTDEICHFSDGSSNAITRIQASPIVSTPARASRLRGSAMFRRS